MILAKVTNAEVRQVPWAPCEDFAAVELMGPGDVVRITSTGDAYVVACALLAYWTGDDCPDLMTERIRKLLAPLFIESGISNRILPEIPR